MATSGPDRPQRGSLAATSSVPGQTAPEPDDVGATPAAGTEPTGPNAPAATAAGATAVPARVPQQAARLRRPADLLFAVVSGAVVLAVLGTIHAFPLGCGELADDVSRWLAHVPHWLSYAAELAAGIGCFVLAVFALAAMLRAQWRDARNACAAAAVAGAGAIVAWAIWRTEHGAVLHSVIHHTNPSLFVVDTAFIAFLVGSDLVRRSRWTRWCTWLAVAQLVTGLAVRTLTPFAVLITLFGGLLAGWLVRWLLRTASARPSLDEIQRWLDGHDVALSHFTSVGQHSRLAGFLADGTPVEVHLANRDTRGAGVARTLWRLIRLRSAVPAHLVLSSRSQLEQLALACALAQQAGLVSPAVLVLDEMPGESLVLAVARPAGGTQPGDAVSHPEATALFATLRALHRAGIAHRDLRPANLLLVPGGGAGFASLDAAVPGAGELARRLDVAQLLTTLSRVCGADGAVSALRDGYASVDEKQVAAVLQPIALAPWGWSAMREGQGRLDGVRRALVGEDAVAPITRLERFRWRTVTSTVALIVAAYLLIGQISKVNLLGTLKETNPGWFALAVVASAVTYFAAAQNLAAFVPKKLSPLRGFGVQLATAFVGVAMPPTVGHVAVNARYLHRQHVDEGSISAAVALSQVVNVVSGVLLLVSFGLLTGSGLSRFKIAPGGDVVIGLAAVAAVIAILMAVPPTRAKLIAIVWPHLRSTWPRLLEAAAQPVRLAKSAGSNLLLTAAYLVAFIAALWAVGAHPALLPAAVVYLAGNAVGSAAPTPGGLGGVEAVLVAGLTAMGIPADQAIPGVLVFRMATFWLPIPAGWVAYLLLQRRGTL